MTNNKKNKKNKVKKEYKISEYKTKEERQEQVKTIINEISKLELSNQYEPVKELYAYLKKYIDEGVVVKINIPFPMIRRTIVGELKIGKNEECVICLQNNHNNNNNNNKLSDPKFFIIYHVARFYIFGNIFTNMNIKILDSNRVHEFK